MSDAVKSLTSLLWPFAILLIGFVILQASTFLKTALSFNKKHNVLTQQEVKGAFKTGAFSVIGPAFSVVVISLTLMQLVGSAATFMRVGVIGSASYELNLANQAADAIGATLGSADITTGVLTLCLFGMILGSAPYFLNCFLTLKPMDAALSKPKEAGKVSFTPILGLAASIGLIGRSVTVQVMNGLPYIVSVAVGAVLTIVIKDYVKKSGKKSLNDWILAICLICGMAAGMLTKSLVA